MKYSEEFNRDYDFYLRHRGRFSQYGGSPPPIPFDPSGVDPKRGFWTFETRGQIVPCTDPELFSEVLRCKRGINLHIKMWADGWDDVCEPTSYYMGVFDDPPPWVEQSLRNQVMQGILRRHRRRG